MLVVTSYVEDDFATEAAERANKWECELRSVRFLGSFAALQYRYRKVAALAMPSQTALVRLVIPRSGLFRYGSGKDVGEKNCSYLSYLKSGLHFDFWFPGLVKHTQCDVQ